MTGSKTYQIHFELIERCRKGDRLAQREIYRLYYKAMYNACYRMLKDQAEAEDVMQEAFLSAFLKIDTYRGEMSFGAWLKRIVINKSIDILRTRKIRFEELDDRLADKPETEHESWDEEQLAGKINLIRNTIDKLPDGFRIVLSLALFEGYDHEEIAAILNISESTSRSQLTRAKKKLIAYLKNENDEAFG